MIALPYNPTYTPYYPQGYYQPPLADQLTQYRQQQYQPMQPAPQMQPTPQPQAQGQGQSIIWVQNQQEAYNYLVAPNSAVALWDSNSPVIYLKQADASGKPTMKVYDLVERTMQRAQAAQQPAQDYVTRQEFEALQARIDALTQPKPSARKAAAAKEEEPNA